MLTPTVSPRSERNTRHENQDAFGHFATPYGDLYVVSDGMGGHKNGREAADIAVRTFQEVVASAHGAGKEAGAALQDAAREAHARVRARAAEASLGHNGMGATVVAALHTAHGMVIGHAGDSRAYLCRNGKLLRLTKDHSVVQQMVDAGILSEDEARRHPDASRITAAVGIHEQVGFELQPHAVPVSEGDALLLCSDGLCGYATDEDIQARIMGNQDPRRMADELVALARQHGSDDNITVLYLQFGERGGTDHASGHVTGATGGPRSAEARASGAGAARSFVNGLLAGMVLVAILLLCIWLFLRWQQRHAKARTKAAPGAAAPHAGPTTGRMASRGGRIMNVHIGELMAGKEHAGCSGAA